MKNGFTLIELLGVIVILSIIALIATPVIQSTIKKNKTVACKDQIKLYEKAAKNYVANNPYKYECGREEQLKINDLIENGYIDDNVTNPKGGEFSGYVKITLSCENENYKYSFEYISGDDEITCEG